MEMYKMARKKKSALSYLTNILEDGLFVATAAYINAKGSRNLTMLELFLDEGEVFAKAHAKLSKIKNGYLTEEIRQRSENCKQWMDQQAQNQYI
jgi:5'-3' exonuclease